MRHSSIDLTMNVYTDPKLLDIHGALNALPTLSLDDAQLERLRATGTDEVARPLAPTLAPNPGASRQTGAIADKQAMQATDRSDSITGPATAEIVEQSTTQSTADNGSAKWA